MNPRWAAASRNSKERLPLAHHMTNTVVTNGKKIHVMTAVERPFLV
ncbi:hypothetical protein ABU162_15250 [Paenibacillus thiaminolyticus]